MVKILAEKRPEKLRCTAGERSKSPSSHIPVYGFVRLAALRLVSATGGGRSDFSNPPSVWACEPSADAPQFPKGFRSDKSARLSAAQVYFAANCL